MNPFTDIRALVIDCLGAMAAEGALPAGLDFTAVSVEPPRDAAHGDMATNAAMALARLAGRAPRDIAEALAIKLRQDSRLSSVEVAGPGFLNLRLVAQVWRNVIKTALTEGSDFGRSRMGAGRKVNVEYISANPTGPLHVGHARGAVFGDALANLLEFAGYAVTREYYINDGGAQVDALARSVYLRYLEAHGLDVEFAADYYPGDYLVPVGRALADAAGTAYVDQPEDVWLDEVRRFAIDAMMELIREDLALLGVTIDVFFSERSLYGTGRIEEAIGELRRKGLIYRGVLEPPRGKMPEDWEAREQTLFKSTIHGDDVDRPIMRSDGRWTYFAPDIAYHYDKIQRGFDVLINIFGADHGGYVKRLQAVMGALSDDRIPLEIKLTQLVKLYKNGAPFKMSKRSGTFVSLRDVVEQVGTDVTRFVMLTRKNDAPLDFDFDKALEQSKDNAVFYVQYAYARIRSVHRKAVEVGIDTSPEMLTSADLSSISDETELALARKVAEWPRLVEVAARTREPHRIAFCLYELASDLHALWNKGNVHPGLRFLQDGDPAATQAKLALIQAVAVVISAGFAILGVEPVEEMR